MIKSRFEYCPGITNARMSSKHFVSDYVDIPESVDVPESVNEIFVNITGLMINVIKYLISLDLFNDKVSIRILSWHNKRENV